MSEQFIQEQSGAEEDVFIVPTISLKARAGVFAGTSLPLGLFFDVAHQGGVFGLFAAAGMAGIAVGVAPAIAPHVKGPWENIKRRFNEKMYGVEEGTVEVESVTTQLPETTKRLPTQQTQHPTEGLFDIDEEDDTSGIRRFTVEEIVEKTQYNSYHIWIGRSLTDKKNRGVWIDLNNTHLKVIGASQKGKSSMIGALISIITQTHDIEHVLFALLDLENKTSRLFADIPNLAQVTISGRQIPLHARTKEEVAEYLGYIVAVMDQRYTLKEHEVEQLPILFVYIEEFLDLKRWFKLQISAAKGEEAKEEARHVYEKLVADITVLAIRGLKARIQLIICAQMDYMDEDFRVALNNISTGLSFCVKPTAAIAAGFTRTDLVNLNFEGNKKGTAVVTSSEAQDLILAPEFNLRQRLKELSLAQAEADRAKYGDAPRSTFTSMLTATKSTQLKNAEQIPAPWTPVAPIPEVPPTPQKRVSGKIDLETILNWYDTGRIDAAAMIQLMDRLPVVDADDARYVDADRDTDPAQEVVSNEQLAEWGQVIDFQSRRMADNIPMKSQPATPRLRKELQDALDLYYKGYESYRKLGDAMGIDKDRAGKLIRELQEMGLIAKAN
jgi:hypothetical protein